MDLDKMRELAGVTETTELQKTLNENMFQGGYGHEKSGSEQVVAELAQMLRDIKVFMRDGNMKDAAMMVDRAYSRAAGAKRGE
jgi:hypothetical protein